MRVYVCVEGVCFLYVCICVGVCVCVCAGVCVCVCVYVCVRRAINIPQKREHLV